MIADAKERTEGAIRLFHAREVPIMRRLPTDGEVSKDALLDAEAAFQIEQYLGELVFGFSRARAAWRAVLARHDPRWAEQHAPLFPEFSEEWQFDPSNVGRVVEQSYGLLGPAGRSLGIHVEVRARDLRGRQLAGEVGEALARRRARKVMLAPLMYRRLEAHSDLFEAMANAVQGWADEGAVKPDIADHMRFQADRLRESARATRQLLERVEEPAAMDAEGEDEV